MNGVERAFSTASLFMNDADADWGVVRHLKNNRNQKPIEHVVYIMYNEREKGILRRVKHKTCKYLQAD